MLVIGARVQGLLLMVGLAAAAGCRGTPMPAAEGSAPGGDAERRIAALRLQLAADPRDAATHLELSRALLAAGRPGGALRHYAEAHRRRALGGKDRRDLASLYLERAAARIHIGDGEAWRDVDAARSLDRTAAARRRGLARDALLAGALAGFRRGDRPGHEQALSLLGRAAPLMSGDARLALRDPEAADLAALGAAGAWLSDGGARRVAFETYERYIGRGGREARHLRRYVALFRWWYGDRERPSGLVLDDARKAGVDVCVFARTPVELGCAERFAGIAESEEREVLAAAREMSIRAAAQRWRGADPALVAPWAIMALHSWVEGAGADWTDGLRARVDVEAIASSAEALARVPVYARPTLLRAAGRGDQAAAALTQAIDGAATSTPPARALLIAEAIASRRDDAVVDRLLGSPTADLAWRVALTGARAEEKGGAREAALLARAPGRVRTRHLRRFGELGALAALSQPGPGRGAKLARWRAALADARFAAGRDAVEARWRALAGVAALPADGAASRLGVPDATQLRAPSRAKPREASALARLVRAYRRDPAVADRLAQDFVDGAVALGERAPLLIELFARLNDPARAWSWAERLLVSSPSHPPYLALAGETSAAVGAVDRADVFFVRGAAGSGEAGAASLRAARVYLDLGYALQAVAAGRRAVQLTAPGEREHAEAIAVAAAGLERLGREREAIALRARVPVVPVEGEERAAPLPATDDPRWAEEVASRLGAALVWRGARARAELGVIAESLEEAGMGRLAATVRAERRAR